MVKIPNVRKIYKQKKLNYFMKKDKEVIWLVKLLSSKYIKKPFGSKGGCKRDFETEIGIFENDKYFRKFLNELIFEEILEVFETKKTEYYVVNKIKLINKLKEKELYMLFKKAVEEEHIVI